MGVHRWLVEALGDPTARDQLGPDGFLPGPEWKAAVERVIRARFGDLPAEEAALAVGAFLAHQFLESEAGRLTGESLRILPLDRALVAVLMPMSDRMRHGAQFDFRPRPEGGGFIDVRGEIAAGAATLLGFYQVMLALIPGEHEVRLAAQSHEFISLEVSVIARR